MFNDENWNDDVYDDIEKVNYKTLKVYSRDWTVDTIFNQITQGNIDLNPKFQRRNAWKDDKRSMLIESLILGVPVPQIVLAEDPYNKNSFIVIDGKQRLLTILGFLDPIRSEYWRSGRLTKLKERSDLNGLRFEDLSMQTKRDLLNSDIRCTVISNVKDIDVLYDIFYRINTGSVPLSTQELRQVLYRSDFADYLYTITAGNQPIHRVLGISGADQRLRDIEILLRFFSLVLLGANYRGNLKIFLDQSMEYFAIEWETMNQQITKLYDRFNESISKLEKVFPSELIGRRLTRNKQEKLFNKVLFEVQVYYFMFIEEELLTVEKIKEIQDAFYRLCENQEFRETIEHTTKSTEKYEQRFRLFEQEIVKDLELFHGEIPMPTRR